MNFQEALELMRKGEYLSRSGWDAEGPNSGFVCIMPDMLNIWKIIQKPTPNAGVFMCTIADLLAEDWYVRDRNHTKPELQALAS